MNKKHVALLMTFAWFSGCSTSALSLRLREPGHNLALNSIPKDPAPTFGMGDPLDNPSIMIVARRTKGLHPAMSPFWGLLPLRLESAPETLYMGKQTPIILALADTNDAFVLPTMNARRSRRR